MSSVRSIVTRSLAIPSVVSLLNSLLFRLHLLSIQLIFYLSFLYVIDRAVQILYWVGR